MNIEKARELTKEARTLVYAASSLLYDDYDAKLLRPGITETDVDSFHEAFGWLLTALYNALTTHDLAEGLIEARLSLADVADALPSLRRLRAEIVALIDAALAEIPLAPDDLSGLEAVDG